MHVLVVIALSPWKFISEPNLTLVACEHTLSSKETTNGNWMFHSFALTQHLRLKISLCVKRVAIATTMPWWHNGTSRKSRRRRRDFFFAFIWLLPLVLSFYQNPEHRAHYTTITCSTHDAADDGDWVHSGRCTRVWWKERKFNVLHSLNGCHHGPSNNIDLFADDRLFLYFIKFTETSPLHELTYKRREKKMHSLEIHLEFMVNDLSAIWTRCYHAMMHFNGVYTHVTRYTTIMCS